MNFLKMPGRFFVFADIGIFEFVRGEPVDLIGNERFCENISNS